MFGLTMDKIAIIAVFAAFVIGPSRLPAAAQQLAALVRRLRGLTDVARERAKEELGDGLDDVEWRTLDPRQYDPRRIIRDALTDHTDS
jgi:sec-independent protein translocase protein TatB